MLITPSAAGTVVEGALCVRLNNSYLCGIVCSINAKDNPASGKVMTKVGFRYQSDGVYSSWNQERKFESKEYLLIVE